MKIVKKTLPSRNTLSNSYPSNTLQKRLIKNKAINMEKNSEETDLGGGYISIKPIDENKLYKGP